MLHRITISLAVAVLGTGVQSCNDSPTFIAEEDRILAITITNPCSVIEVGARCNISAQAFAEGGFELSNPVLLWTSSRPEVLAVEAQRAEAFVRGLRGGSSTVTVADPSNPEVSQQVSVTVVADPNPGGGGPRQ